MDEYIKRADVLALAKCGAIVSTDYDRRCRELINDIPAADVRLVVRGKWISRKNEPKHRDWWTCSECKGQFDFQWYFCPNCGADMRGEAEG